MRRLTAALAVCIMAALCARPTVAHAQAAASGATGTIAGVVLDAASGDPIIEAGVEVMGAGLKTRTDLDGKFEIKAPAGTYELRIFAPLYQGTRLRGVVVADGKETKANASLKPEGDAAVEVVEVVAEAKKAAEATQLLQRKAAPVVSDNVGSEEAKKAPDSSAAEIVQRLPSVTVSEDDFVFVRGLNERYTLGVLSKSRLPSTDPDKRVVPLNVFPADFIDSINILKTYQPSMPGDAAGGLIDINLKDPPERLTCGIGMSMSANTQVTGKSFDSYKGGRYDYFGFGEDYRTPDDLPDQFGPDDEDGQPAPLGPAQQRAAASMFRNIWNVDSDGAPPDWDLNFNVGNAWGPLSVALFGKYKNEHKRRSNEVIADTINAQGGTNEFLYRRSEFDTELSGVLVGAWKISPEHKLNLRSFVYHYSSDEVLNGVGESESFGFPQYPTFLEYEQGQLGVGQLTGAHHFDWLDVDWRGALAQTSRALPDKRFYNYNTSPNGPGEPPVLATTQPSLQREFDDLEEFSTDSAVDFTVPFATRLPGTDVWSGLPAKFQTGLAYSYRKRDYALRRFNYQLISGSEQPLDLTLSPEDLLVPSNIGTNFRFSEQTLQSDSFHASQEIAALYGQLDLPLIRDRLRLIGGARLEYSYILSKGGYLANPGGSPTFEIPINDLDVLPAINLVFSPRNDMNLRWGWSQTVSRPEFRELQPTEQFRPFGDRPVTGNQNLTSASVDSYDLRWEWFFGDRELVSLGGFYKMLENPIEKSTLKRPTYNSDTFVNADSATLGGFELEGRKNFSMLAPLTSRSRFTEPITPYLSNFRLIANISYIHSNADVQEVGEEPRSRPLQGQPDFVVNAALEYEQLDFLTTRLSYYTVGERLDSIGIVSEGIPDTFEQRRDQLDFVLIKPFTVFETSMTARLSVENILNDQFLKLQDDFVARRYTTGVKFTAGLSYTF